MIAASSEPKVRRSENLPPDDRTPRHRRYDLDLFRFLAAVSVMWFHYTFRGYAADDMTVMPFAPGWQAAKYGYLAVQFFFMISGYVILMSARSATAASFAISRARRLFPSFWLCCTLTFVCTRLFHDPRHQVSLIHYLKNMTLVPQFFESHPVDPSYWSLSYEIRFYCLILLLLLCGRIAKIQSYLLAWALLSLVLLAHPLANMNYRFIPDFAGFFIAGCCFYLIEANGSNRLTLAALACALALAVITALRQASEFSLHYRQDFRSPVVIAVVVSFFVVFYLFVSGRTRRLAWPGFGVLGAISYPLYLLHENIGFMIFDRLYPAVSPFALSLGVGFLMVGVSWVVCRCFENRAQVWLRAFLEKLTAFL